MKISHAFYMILVLIICISLFSCQKNSTNEEEITSEEITSSEITQDTNPQKETETETEAMEFSNYYMIADAKEFDEARNDLKSMIAQKYNVEPSGNYGSGIRLTSDGATAGKISVKLEGSELVVRAANAKEMKKAVACFWYENISYFLYNSHSAHMYLSLLLSKNRY